MMRITNFSKLTYAINQLGVTITKEAREYREALYEGFDVDESTQYIAGDKGIFTVDPDGKIHKVMLYITQRDEGGRVPISEDWQDWHKFHILNCRTIQSYDINRKHRYKMASRVDGLFAYTIYRDNELHKEFKGEDRTRLKLCFNCKKLFNEQQDEPFDLEKFILSNDNFSALGTTYEYEYQDVPNQYSKDWEKISELRKKQKKWKCEICQIDLSAKKHRKFLHGHHIDGNRANSTSKNIEILCIKCHAEKPHHAHMVNLPFYQEFIDEFC